MHNCFLLSISREIRVGSPHISAVALVLAVALILAVVMSTARGCGNGFVRLEWRRAAAPLIGHRSFILQEEPNADRGSVQREHCLRVGRASEVQRVSMMFRARLMVWGWSGPLD